MATKLTPAKIAKLKAVLDGKEETGEKYESPEMEKAEKKGKKSKKSC